MKGAGPDRAATFAVTTLGCRANQSDSGEVDSRLIEAGMRRVEFGRPADVTVVNTCTVTGPSDRQSRQLVHRALRASPSGLVFVMGCWPRFREEEADRVTDRAAVIKRKDPEKVAEMILERCRAEGLMDRRVPLPPDERNPGPTVTRPPLKVQDGCDGSCAYCAVRIARGRSRSAPLNRVLARLDRFSAQGIQEVVLTGINLGSWGRDLDPPSRLTDLLEVIREERPVARVRLSSVEPQEVESDLLGLMARPDSLVCHHLHLPLQSGSDRVLSAMARPYTADAYEETVRLAAGLMEDGALGADVMVGLPMEGEREFAETVDLVESLPLTYMHVFPYSPRPGTPAYEMGPVAPVQEAKARGAVLRDLAERKRRRFWESQKGRVRPAVVETRRCDRTGNLVAVTDNFIPVRVQGPDSLMGRLAEVRILDVADRVTGETV